MPVSAKYEELIALLNKYLERLNLDKHNWRIVPVYSKRMKRNKIIEPNIVLKRIKVNTFDLHVRTYENMDSILRNQLSQLAKRIRTVEGIERRAKVKEISQAYTPSADISIRKID